MEQTRKRIWQKIGLWTLAGLWTALLAVFSALPGQAADRLFSSVARMLHTFLQAFVQELSLSFVLVLTPWLLRIGLYGVLAVCLWFAFRLTFVVSRWTPVFLSMAGCVLCAVVNELEQLFVAGRDPQIIDCLANIGLCLIVLNALLLLAMACRRFPKVLNRETVSYVVFGAITTVINIVCAVQSYTLLQMTALSDAAVNSLSNIVAWTIAVLFAFFVNKWFVFQSKTASFRAALREFWAFIVARLLSLLVDIAGMLLLVELLHAPYGLSKIGMNVIVLLINYFLSKWFIFSPKTPPAAEKAADDTSLPKQETS